MIIRGSHRAYMGANTDLVAFVRNDDGPADLSGADISARIYAGQGREVVAIPAQGDSSGRVDFTVDGLTTDQRLQPGSFDLWLEADGRVVYTAILEIV